MTTLEQQQRTEQRRSRAPWLAASAAVIVLTAGAVAMVVVRDDDQDVDASAAAVAVAEEFVAAGDAWDAPSTQELLADGVDPAYFANPEFERVSGVQFDDANCTPTTTDAPVAVTCTYQMHNAWSDALGTGPFDGAFELVVKKGLITSVVNNFPFGTNGFSPGAWEPFLNWMRTTHPDDVDVMYSDHVDNMRVTPDALALWATRTTEFVDSEPTTTD
jgi:hypothetical protein